MFTLSSELRLLISSYVSNSWQNLR